MLLLKRCQCLWQKNWQPFFKVTNIISNYLISGLYWISWVVQQIISVQFSTWLCSFQSGFVCAISFFVVFPPIFSFSVIPAHIWCNFFGGRFQCKLPIWCQCGHNTRNSNLFPSSWSVVLLWCSWRNQHLSHGVNIQRSKNSWCGLAQGPLPAVATCLR